MSRIDGEELDRLVVQVLSGEVAETSHGRFRLAALQLPFAQVLHSRLQIDRPFSRTQFLDRNHLHLSFHLAGYGRAAVAGINKTLEAAADRSHLLYCHQPEVEFYYGSGSHEHIELLLEPTYFLNKLGVDGPLAERWNGLIAKERSHCLNEQGQSLTPVLRRVLHELLSGPVQGPLAPLYLEAKISELLFHWLEPTMTRADVLTGAHRREVELLHEVRRYLEATYDQPHSLEALCRRFGVNEYKLKKGFRELFGKTVFGYLLWLKLEEAKRLLLAGELTVSQVSDYIGYSSPAHFATAFKKEFGVNPRAVLR